MNIIEKIDTKRNGAYFALAWTTNLNKKMKSSARDAGLLVTKEVKSVGRKGIRYSHVKGVEAKGKGISWASQIDGHSNAFIKHTENGKIYLKVYKSPNIPKVTYKLNGVVISEEALKMMNIMQEGYWKNKDTNPMYMVPIDNITWVK